MDAKLGHKSSCGRTSTPVKLLCERSITSIRFILVIAVGNEPRKRLWDKFKFPMEVRLEMSQGMDPVNLL